MEMDENKTGEKDEGKNGSDKSKSKVIDMTKDRVNVD